MKPMRLFGLAGLFVASAASHALAAPPTPTTAPSEQVGEPDRFDAMLRQIDVVPADRAALEAAFPDAWARLDAAAREVARDEWSRLRAVSLLSFFPEARTRTTLESLAADPDQEIRRQAIYTLGRGFGTNADLALVRFIEARAADRAAEVAEHAVRSLRWVDHPEAALALDRLATKGPATLRTLAKTTLDKRAARLATPKKGH